MRIGELLKERLKKRKEKEKKKRRKVVADIKIVFAATL